MPSYRKIIPVLNIVDMNRALGFYVDILGMAVQWRAPADGGGEVCMLGLGSIDLMLSTGSPKPEKPSFTGSLYFDMTGVAELFERIKDRVEVVWPIEVMEYGMREFGIRDRNGYLLAFSEPAEPPRRRNASD